MIASLVTFGIRPAQAAPAVQAENLTPAAELDKSELVALLERGVSAWKTGDFTTARALLEQVAFDGRLASGQPLSDQDLHLRRKALRYLADSVLLDEKLAPHRRQRLAEEHIRLIFELSPDWEPPQALHGDEFYKLVQRDRDARQRRDAQLCEAERIACAADLGEAEADIESLRLDNRRLMVERAHQWVYLEERVARNRALALLPFGIGHIYNGNIGLGVGFIVGEVTLAAIGLGFLIDRRVNRGCVRTAGFSPGSLVCYPKESLTANTSVSAVEKMLERRRRAEEVFGFLLIGSLVIDVLLAQLTFKPYEKIGRRRVRLDQLEAENASDKGRSKKRRQIRKSRPRASKSSGPKALRTLRGGVRFNARGARLSLRMRF